MHVDAGSRLERALDGKDRLVQNHYFRLFIFHGVHLLSVWSVSAEESLLIPGVVRARVDDVLARNMTQPTFKSNRADK